LPEENGRPVVRGPWTAALGRAPLVSVSHVDGTALAIAGNANGINGLGIDLERLGRMRSSMTGVAFTEAELQVLETVDAHERPAWPLRMWSAKEACAKAAAQGFSHGAQAFAVRAFDRQRGTVSIRFKAPDGKTADLTALTAQEGDWIVATCAMAGEEEVQH